MKTYAFRTIIEPDEKGYHGFVPLLKGVHTIGKTIEETKKNLFLKDDYLRFGMFLRRPSQKHTERFTYLLL